MTFRGHIQNGRVEFDKPVDLPEGTPVQVKRAKATAKRARSAASAAASMRTRAKRQTQDWQDILKPLIGKAKGLPRDASVNVDHYLYGAPKK